MTPDPVTHAERIAAARARVVADRKRGVVTEAWVVELAKDESCCVCGSQAKPDGTYACHPTELLLGMLDAIREGRNEDR